MIQEFQESVEVAKGQLEKITKLHATLNLPNNEIESAKTKVSNAMEEIQKIITDSLSSLSQKVSQNIMVLPSVQFTKPSNEEMSQYLNEISNLSKAAKTAFLLPEPKINISKDYGKRYLAEVQKSVNQNRLVISAPQLEEITDSNLRMYYDSKLLSSCNTMRVLPKTASRFPWSALQKLIRDGAFLIRQRG
ncbi:MAG: hypothetical protein IJJ26_12405 [Victivallales bacterium]|nr:hypothetical protein [Victivallales bacterium]